MPVSGVVMYNEVTGPEDEDVRPSYVICKSIGRITYVTGDNLVDEFTALDTVFSTDDLGPNYKGAMKLYNLSEGGFSYVYPWVHQENLNFTSPRTGKYSYNQLLCL